MLDRTREETLVEQKRVITECYEEKRKIASERADMLVAQKEIIEKGRSARNSTIKVNLHCFSCL